MSAREEVRDLLKSTDVQSPAVYNREERVQKRSMGPSGRVCLPRFLLLNMKEELLKRANLS